MLPQGLLQVGLDYSRLDKFKTKGTLTQGADDPSADHYSYHYQIASQQTMIDAKLLYACNHRFHPYILAGLGAAFNKASDFEAEIPAFSTFTRQYNDHSTVEFSYNLGIGLDVDITPQFRAGLGYRFTDIGKVHLDSAIIDTIPVSGALSQSHLYVNELLVELTWLISKSIYS